MSFLPLDWVRYRNLPQLFYGWSLFWPHHKILKRNPGPDSLSDGAHGVSVKKVMVWLSHAFRILASWISQSFICHTYIIIAAECMLSWLFFFSHCRTNVTQSSQSTAEILKIENWKCVSIRENLVPEFSARVHILWSLHITLTFLRIFWNLYTFSWSWYSRNDILAQHWFFLLFCILSNFPSFPHMIFLS